MDDELDDAGLDEPDEPPPAQPCPPASPAIVRRDGSSFESVIPGVVDSEAESGNPIRMKLGNKIRQLFGR